MPKVKVVHRAYYKYTLLCYDDLMTDVITDELIKALRLADSYELTKLAGHANDNYLISAGDRKIVVKCLGEHTPENEQLKGVYRQYLMENGLPVAPFLKFTNGTYVFTDKGKSYVALDFVEGQEARGKEEQVTEQVAGLLAKIHLLPHDTLPERVNWFDGGYVERVINEVQLGGDEAGELRKQTDTFSSLWDGSLRLGIVHGDLHLGNIIIDNTNQIATVIDWEEVGIVPVIFDIAGTIQSLAQTDDGYNTDLFNRFFEAYQAIRPLTHAEKSMFPEAVRYVSFIVYVWALMKYKQGHMGHERYQYFKRQYDQPVKVPPVR